MQDTGSAMGKWYREGEAANKSQVIKPVTTVETWGLNASGKASKMVQNHLKYTVPSSERAEIFFYQLPRAAQGREVESVTCPPHSI